MRGPATAAGVAALGAIVALLAVLALPAGTAHTASDTFHVRMHDGGGQHWFTMDGVPGRNPSVVLQPGRTYTFEVSNEGTMQHDFWVGETQVVKLLAKGEKATGTFSSEEATLEYYCSPHRGLGMKGRFTVGDGEANGSPGPLLGVPLALLGAAMLRRRALA